MLWVTNYFLEITDGRDYGLKQLLSECVKTNIRQGKKIINYKKHLQTGG